MKCIPNLSVKLETKLSDGTSTSATIKEGTGLTNMIYMDYGREISVSGDVEVIKYNEDRRGNIDPTSFIIRNDKDGKMVHVPILKIKNCGTPNTEVSDNESIADVIGASESDVTMKMSAGSFPESIDVSKNVTIKGAYAFESATSGSRCSDVTLPDETVLTGAIAVSGSTLTLDGVTLTENTIIKPDAQSSVVFKNCRFVNVTPNIAKTHMVITPINPDASPNKITIEGCYFGNNTITGTNKMYHCFELGAKVADGSYIKNCYFAENCCKHNIISFYDVEDGATIDVSNNTFEHVANAVRIGTNGDTTFTLNMDNNTYMTTSNDDYCGLVIVQPYPGRTTSFGHVTINMNNTKNLSDHEQIIYAYRGPNDIAFNEETLPKVFVNGVKTPITIAP